MLDLIHLDSLLLKGIDYEDVEREASDNNAYVYAQKWKRRRRVGLSRLMRLNSYDALLARDDTKHKFGRNTPSFFRFNSSFDIQNFAALNTRNNRKICTDCTAEFSSLFVPNEMLDKVFHKMVFDCNCILKEGVVEQQDNNCKARHLKYLLSVRSVCRSWNSFVAATPSLFTATSIIRVNRFVISFDSSFDVYELRWCDYSRRKARTMRVTRDDVRRMQLYSVSFSRFDIQRIVFQNLMRESLDDQLIAFICRQFEFCPTFSPHHLSIRNASMAALSAGGLQQLISACATSLEAFEVERVSGLRPDSISDTHLSQFNINKLRRFTIESTKFAAGVHKSPALSLLQISDRTLEKFSHCGQFPSLILERCRVTVNGVLQYMENWLVKDVGVCDNETNENRVSIVPNTLDNVGSHMFTLKECPAISQLTMQRECRRRSLDFEADDENRNAVGQQILLSQKAELENSAAAEQPDDEQMMSYSIYKVNAVKEFLIRLSASTAIVDTKTTTAICD